MFLNELLNIFLVDCIICLLKLFILFSLKSIIYHVNEQFLDEVQIVIVFFFRTTRFKAPKLKSSSYN